MWFFGIFLLKGFRFSGDFLRPLDFSFGLSLIINSPYREAINSELAEIMAGISKRKNHAEICVAKIADVIAKGKPLTNQSIRIKL
jgi:hypoxanthine-guanine phosphoribosyltransferase